MTAPDSGPEESVSTGSRHPRTAAGRAWLDEEHPAGTKTLHTQHARQRMADRILAIEAEARDLARHDALPPMGDRLTAIIESRMSQELAWLRDDGKTVEMWDPEHIGWGLAHLYLTGDVVSGLPPLEAEAAAGTALDVERLARALLACNWMLDLGDGVDADQYRGEEAQRIAAEYARLAAATAEPKG